MPVFLVRFDVYWHKNEYIRALLVGWKTNPYLITGLRNETLRTEVWQCIHIICYILP